MQKSDNHIFSGLAQDLSPSKHSPELLKDALNIRVTARDNDTQLSVTNERGTSIVKYGNSNIIFNGAYVGHCVLGNYLVVFTHKNSYTPYIPSGTITTEEPAVTGSPTVIDYIYRVDVSKGNTTEILYKGNLGFDPGYPIETLGSYENENIQKVYWVDGLHQPRVINITKDKLLGYNWTIKDSEDNYVNYTELYNEAPFDFVQELTLGEEIKVNKKIEGGGIFAPGCIQYAFSYYHKYGQESNIFYSTPIHYISFNNRAGSPEDKCSNSFEITISNPDTKFDFLRIYSIHRTSLNATPTVKVVADLNLSEFKVMPTEPPEGDTVYTYTLYHNNMTGPTDAGHIFTGSEYTTEFCKNCSGVNSSNLIFSRASSLGINPTYIDKTEGTIPYPYDQDEIINGQYYIIDSSKYPYFVIRIQVSQNSYQYYTWNNETDGTKLLLIPVNPIPKYNTITGNPEGQWEVFAFNVNSDTSAPLISYAGTSNNILYYKQGNSTTGDTTEEELPTSISYIDNGTTGSIIDPTELLYLGGESIIASTLTNKDNTLFLGNLSLIRKDVYDGSFEKTVKDNTSVEDSSKTVNSSLSKAINDFYKYFDTNSYQNNSNLEYLGYFKKGETYRFGLQFQHKSGKWSSPIFIEDHKVTSGPVFDTNHLCTAIPRVTLRLSSIVQGDYTRVRPVVVFPNENERTVLAQGILCPTVHNSVLGYMSSWFARPYYTIYKQQGSNDFSNALDYTVLQSTHNKYVYTGFSASAEIASGPIISNGNKYYKNAFNTIDLSIVNGSVHWASSTSEPGTITDEGNLFAVSREVMTFHSPDIELDDNFANVSLGNISLKHVGETVVDRVNSDISITTSSASRAGSGFTFNLSSGLNRRSHLCSGFWYSERIQDDRADGGDTYTESSTTAGGGVFMVYPWQSSGSLSNDFTNKNNTTSVLKRKVISNMLYCNTLYNSDDTPISVSDSSYFNSDQVTLSYIGSDKYFGNVDTAVMPNSYDGTNSGTIKLDGGAGVLYKDNSNPAESTIYLGIDYTSDNTHKGKIVSADGSAISGNGGQEIGSRTYQAVAKTNPIRLRYKSSPHLVVKLSNFDSQGGISFNSAGNFSIESKYNIYDLIREVDVNTRFGGTSKEALENNLWLPCGEPVTLPKYTNPGINIYADYGDTWIQRFDCLKTYPYSQDDENSVVEIISFPIETRINIEGRYDKNKGNTSNIYANNTNFNLINPVYSQRDSFFNYRILDTDYYNLNSFPSSLTWTKEKQPAAKVDLWTNTTMAETLDLDGEHGKLNYLDTIDDSIYAFQDTGISKVLFNERVQIPVSDGVPVEISNGYKVQGSVYITDSIGCTNKWSIVKGVSSLFFIDNNSHDLYRLNNGSFPSPISAQNMHIYYKNLPGTTWSYTDKWRGVKNFYDYNHNDLYTVSADDCLNYSERLTNFVSRFSYESTPAMFNISDSFYAIKNDSEDNNKRSWISSDGTQKKTVYYVDCTSSLHKLFSAENKDYNKFFGKKKGFKFSFISNADVALDKTFTNIEVRAQFQKFTDKWNDSSIFFNRISAENDYQESTSNVLQTTRSKHFTGDDGPNLKRKFRVWRMDIPRMNRDRIRNTWTKLTLTKNITTNEDACKMEMHDLNVLYHI